ncbi:hypothetical protein LJC20_05200 [Eubacteriales bacterium OttesenSCG-928-M02]|nr:hypothetical protein [Eubacteriales bacterium OttesenSCG-928-M02]
MKLQKCPRCELNYVRPGNEYCDICIAELKEIREKKRAKEAPVVDICPECNENPVVPGQEMCKLCLIEKRRLEEAERMRLAAVTHSDEEDEVEEEDPLDGMIEEVPEGEEIPVPDDAGLDDLEDEFEEDFDEDLEDEFEEDFDEFEEDFLEDELE